MMKTLVFLLEERSAQALLEGLLPRILPPDVTPFYVVFEGKQDLEKQLEKRLRGWRRPDSIFLVLRDQDSGDCHQIKQKLATICVNAGKPEAIVRIACRELESWYLGDLVAVEKALSIAGLSKHANAAKFRVPDRLGNPSEELRKLTRGRYEKIAGSRAIGPLLNLEKNLSRSFQVLLQALRRIH